VKVTPSNQKAVELYDIQRKNGGEKPGRAKVDASSHEDILELSDQARDIQAYRAKLAELSDIREDRVKEIKKMIGDRTFRFTAEDIAEGILKERMLDKRV
jgi:negative regulator of flagellin synthesis FlgM